MFMRHIKSGNYVFLVIVALSGMNAFAADRYVLAGGSGAQDGSDWENAYSDLPASLDRGDVYYVADGDYSGHTFDTRASGSTMIVIKKAVISDHGTNVGWADSYGDGQAIFNGGLQFNSSYWLVDGQTGGGAENNWADGFGFKVIEKSNGTALISLGEPGTSGYANNIEVRHVDLEGKGRVSNQGGSYSNDGIAAYGSTNVTLSYYRMQGIGRTPFFLSVRDFVAEHGWVESFFGSSDVHSEVASIWDFAHSVGDVTFRHNLFTDIQSTGGLIWDNVSNKNAVMSVYGNVFYKPPGASWDEANGLIGGWTGGNGEEFHNVAVYNNTFVNVDQLTLSSFPNVYSGNSAYNNLFHNCDTPQWSRFSSHGSNHFIDTGGSSSDPNGSTGSGDPFVNAAGLDFRLKSATPNGAAVQGSMGVDPLGLTRGADGVIDRGAFEFNSATASKTPRSPSNVSAE